MFQLRPSQARGDSQSLDGLTPSTLSPLVSITTQTTWGFETYVSSMRTKCSLVKASVCTDIETWKSSLTISGELAHKDSMGNGSTIVRGDVQRMSAGTGVQHSEFNASNSDTVHFLQIWLLPNQVDTHRDMKSANFAGERHNTLRLLVSGDACADALHINSDIQLFGSELDAGQSLTHEFSTGRHGWVQVIKGSLTISDGSLTHTPCRQVTNWDCLRSVRLR